MKIKTSFTEMNARMRAEALLDGEDKVEMLGPFSRLKSPHLMKQGIVAQNDDGMIIMKGKMSGYETVVIAMEGKFQGGGIGEISGAKFAAALENIIEDNQTGKRVFPLIIMDTGGVRLQEANYGLLAISEIQDLIIRLRKWVPVIGIIPGKVGCFGGMSMTCALFSYILMTKEGRLTLNGPEVIEQEAGVNEWNSKDKAFTYRVIGGEQRVNQGIADILVHDDVEKIKEAITECIRKKIPVHRSVRIDYYSKNVEKYAPQFQNSEEVPITRGKIWFRALTGNDGKNNNINSVLFGNVKIKGEDYCVITVVPDKDTLYPRTLNGEVGLQQGWEIARLVRKIIREDKGKERKRPIIALVDVPSQAYGYLEEVHGIFLSCAGAVNAYVDARAEGHPVITFIVGNAISGAFLAHGLQGSYMLALNDEMVTVHAMSKKSAARITKRSISDMDYAANNVPGIAYDIQSFYCLGAINELIKLNNHDYPTEEDVQVIREKIENAARASIKNGNTLSFRLSTVNAKKYRALSIEVRKRMKDEWNKII